MTSKHTVIEDNGKEVTLLGYCPFCGVSWRHKFERESYFLWRKGKLVQHAFPTLDSNQRELLVSGICVVCWNETFGGEG